MLTVSIDLKKAFDTLDNGILLKKLSNFGIRGISLDLLHSYLTNRKQYVSYHNVDSNVRRMNRCIGVYTYRCTSGICTGAVSVSALY